MRVIRLEKVPQLKQLLVFLELINGPSQDEGQVCFWLDVLYFVEDIPQRVDNHELNKLIVPNLVIVKPTEVFVDFVENIRSE